MPVRYPRPPAVEPETNPEVGIGQGGGMRPPSSPVAWFTIAVASTLAACAIVFAALAVSSRHAGDTLTAGSIAAYFSSPHTFEMVELAGGDVYYGQLSDANNVVLLADVYVSDPVSHALAPLDQAELSSPNGPMVINPTSIVRIEPVGPKSLVAQEIARMDASRHGPAPTATTSTTQMPTFQ